MADTKISGLTYSAPVGSDGIPVQRSSSNFMAHAEDIAALAVPNVFNLDPGKYLNFRAAKAKYQRGTGNCRIGFIGDSRPQSYGANALTAMDVQMAKLLEGMGYKTNYQSFIGSKGIDFSAGQKVDNWDSRVSQGAFSHAGPYGFGGEYLFANSAATVSFTPKDSTGAAKSTDNAVIYYATYSGGGTFTKQVDTGSTTSVSVDAANGLAKTTLSYTAGNHTIKANFATSGAGGIYILGMEASTSTEKAINILNMGWAGSKAQWWADTSQGWQPANTWSVVDLDLAFIGLMANDVLYGERTLAQAKADFGTVIDQAKAAGTDVIGLGYPPIKPSSTFYNYNYSYAQQEDLDNAMKEVLASKGCAHLSFFGRNGKNFDTLNTLGVTADDLHLNEVGYAMDMILLARVVAFL